MNFEKKMQKRGNQKLDQFAKNPYHKEQPKVNSFPLWGKILIPTAGVSLALLLGFTVAFIPSLASNKSVAIIDGGSGQGAAHYDPAEATSQNIGGKDNHSQQSPGEGTAHQDTKWNDMTIIEQYPSFTYGDYTYNVRYTDVSKPINASFVKTKLNDIYVHGYDSTKDENHFMNASIYTINQIHEKVSLAIRFENSNVYYAYQNSNYIPESLSDFLEDTCIEKEATILKASSIDLTKENNAETTRDFSNLIDITNILMTDKSPVNTKQYVTKNADSLLANHNEGICLQLKFECLGIDDAEVFFFDDGLMCANLFKEKVASFNIGQDRYLQIKDCVIK